VFLGGAWCLSGRLRQDTSTERAAAAGSPLASALHADAAADAAPSAAVRDAHLHTVRRHKDSDEKKMAQHWIFMNSATYRRFVDSSRQNPVIFWGATGLLCAAASLAASLTMNATNPNMEADGYRDRSEEFSRMPAQAQALARSNRQQLRAMLDDVASGRDAARYRSLLE
jgi:Spy/CpxP family protein refolding chaperone